MAHYDLNRAVTQTHNGTLLLSNLLSIQLRPRDCALVKEGMGRELKVLIVEDDLLVAKAIQAMLEMIGCGVAGIATESTRAFEMAETLRPDIVLLDIELPGLDGIETLRTIYERCPVPAVVLSAYETEDLVARAGAAGAGAYLVKPSSAPEIERAIAIATARFDDMMELRRLNAALQADVEEREQAEEEARSLARFPGENPNPVLRIAGEGTILYANDASRPLLTVWQCRVGQLLPDDWRRFVSEVLLTGSSKDAKVACQGQVLSLTFAPVIDARYVNVYGLDITERERAEEEVTRHSRDLRRLSVQIIDAQEAERKRISQELHDEMGQALTAISLNLVTLGRSLPPESTFTIRERLAETQWLADRLLDQVRELSLDLRPAMLDDLGLGPTLRWYLNRYAQRVNIETTFESASFTERLPAEIETTLYRVIQEALTNIARHAQASKVRVVVERGATDISALVEDDGQGFSAKREANPDDSGGGVGLLGIQERVASLGGSCSIRSHPGCGTALNVRIPLSSQNGVDRPYRSRRRCKAATQPTSDNAQEAARPDRS